MANDMTSYTDLIEEMDVRLSLEVPQGQVLVQRSRSQFLVGGDDVDPLLHPL